METGSSENQKTAKRAVVVANEKVSGDELRNALLTRLDSDSAVFVVAPALADSGLKHTMGDVDDAVGPARERLDATLEELRGAGIEADGEVGDSDPLQALSDEILKFDPEQVFLVAHRDEDGAFAEKGLLEQVERDFDLPVVELVVDHEREPHVLDAKRTRAGAGRKKGWRPSGNWPPLSKRDIAGIIVAIVGTLILGCLAAKEVSESEGGLGAGAAATVLIALAMALLNLAHVVGLVLFQSVSYEGLFNRFFAKLSLIGTPIAVVVSTIIVLTS